MNAAGVLNEMARELPTRLDLPTRLALQSETTHLTDTYPPATSPSKRFSRRLFTGLLVAGGVTAAAPVQGAWAAGAPAGAGLYGSGTLGDWTGARQSVSPPQFILSTVASGGVLAFGDSIGVDTFRDLAVRLLPFGTRLAVNAQGSRPTAPTVDILSQWATTYGLPRRVLMAVGPNDIFDPSGFAAQINRVMTICGPAVTVYWPEIQVSRWSQAAGVQVADQRNSGWLNVQLYAAAARYPNLKIVSWASFLAQKPFRVGAYLSDGVHTTARGTAARNALIVASLQRPG